MWFAADLLTEDVAGTAASMLVYVVSVYAFSSRFYPKRLTNKDITSYEKLTINYIEGTHWSDSVRGDRVEIEWNDT